MRDPAAGKPPQSDRKRNNRLSVAIPRVMFDIAELTGTSTTEEEEEEEENVLSNAGVDLVDSNSNVCHPTDLPRPLVITEVPPEGLVDDDIVDTLLTKTSMSPALNNLSRITTEVPVNGVQSAVAVYNNNNNDNDEESSCREGDDETATAPVAFCLGEYQPRVGPPLRVQKPLAAIRGSSGGGGDGGEVEGVGGGGGGKKGGVEGVGSRGGGGDGGGKGGPRALRRQHGKRYDKVMV